VNQVFAVLELSDFAGFNPVKDANGTYISQEIATAINEVTSYYTQHNPLQLELLNSLIDSGKLRAGPDDTLTFYGANNSDIYLIATNNNPDLASTIIHELNGLSHDENIQAEEAFQAWRASQKNQLSVIPATQQASLSADPFNPKEPAYYVEDGAGVFQSLHGVSMNQYDLVTMGAMLTSGEYDLAIVGDEHIGNQASLIKADFTAAGQYFNIHYRTQYGAPAYDIYDQNWEVFADNPNNYALRFITLGEGNTYSVILKDAQGRQLVFPVGGEGGLIGANSWKNQVAIGSFSWLLTKAPVGFDWSRVTDFRIRADQAGMMLISDIQIVRFNPDYDIAMGVAGHDLQNDPGENSANWRQRLGNINYFGQPASIYTYFTTIFEPINKDPGTLEHYSDIVERANALRVANRIPSVTLEFRSWAQIALANGTDAGVAAKIAAERARFNQTNAGGITYDNFINNYVNQNKVLDAVNAGLLDPILNATASQMKDLGPIYLRLFHEPYSWFPWGMREQTDIQKFKDAWIHVGQIFEAAGASNVRFVMTLDPFEPGGASWSEVTAIPAEYLDVVELDGYTDPVLRKNANLSSNELFTKKLTEIAWQLELVYPDASVRPSIAIGEFAFSGDAAAGRPKDQVYNWFIHDLIYGAYPYLTRFSILNTYLAGPRPQVNALNYSPAQEGFWSATWQPESPWYNNLLVELGNAVGFWQHPPLVTLPYSIFIPFIFRSRALDALLVTAFWAGLGILLGLASGFGWAIPLFIAAAWNLIKAADIIQ
ncbi:MAG: hypothetical protein COV73_00935, partial [Candidatus Omnitrophica bacterium CG11_big_fil_rev_8_21_14_0_20_43_6]